MPEFWRMEKDAQISPLTVISSHEQASTYRLNLYGCHEGLLGMRKAGTWFGGHYHKGDQRSKSPERLVLLQGELLLYLKDMDTQEEAVHQALAPREIHIQANVWHKLLAVTDVVFVEMNSLEEHVADTHYIGFEVPWK